MCVSKFRTRKESSFSCSKLLKDITRIELCLVDWLSQEAANMKKTKTLNLRKATKGVVPTADLVD